MDGEPVHALGPEHPRFVVLFAVDSFEFFGERPNLENARGFAEGATEGGSYFGDGVSSWMLPDELASFEEFLGDVEDARDDWPRVKAGLPDWALVRVGEANDPESPEGSP